MYALDDKHDHECFFSLAINFEGCKECKRLMLPHWDICMGVLSWDLFRAHDDSYLAGRECCSAGLSVTRLEGSRCVGKGEETPTIYSQRKWCVFSSFLSFSFVLLRAENTGVL